MRHTLTARALLGALAALALVLTTAGACESPAPQQDQQQEQEQGGDDGGGEGGGEGSGEGGDEGGEGDDG